MKCVVGNENGGKNLICEANKVQTLFVNGTEKWKSFEWQSLGANNRQDTKYECKTGDIITVSSTFRCHYGY